MEDREKLFVLAMLVKNYFDSPSTVNMNKLIKFNREIRKEAG